MPNTRGNQTHAGTNNGPDDLTRILRDERIIELRRDGMPLRTIAAAVGVALSTVQTSIKRWMDERGPSAEQVEELRQFQGAQLDAYQAKLAPHLMRKLRNDDGEILYEGPDDNRQPIETPDVNVGRLYLNVLERRAKLYGLDLERSLGAPSSVSAEMLAELFRDAAEPPIDVDCEELPADPPAELGAGADAP
jgi:hypothetical protein